MFNKALFSVPFIYLCVGSPSWVCSHISCGITDKLSYVLHWKELCTAPHCRWHSSLCIYILKLHEPVGVNSCICSLENGPNEREVFMLSCKLLKYVFKPWMFLDTPQCGIIIKSLYRIHMLTTVAWCAGELDAWKGVLRWYENGVWFPVMGLRICRFLGLAVMETICLGTRGAIVFSTVQQAAFWMKKNHNPFFLLDHYKEKTFKRLLK